MKFPHITFARWPGIYVALIHHCDGKSISWFSCHNILWWKSDKRPCILSYQRCELFQLCNLDFISARNIFGIRIASPLTITPSTTLSSSRISKNGNAELGTRSLSSDHPFRIKKNSVFTWNQSKYILYIPKTFLQTLKFHSKRFIFFFFFFFYRIFNFLYIIIPLPSLWSKHCKLCSFSTCI